jgi:phosphatidate phosphatase PAH1
LEIELQVCFHQNIEIDSTSYEKVGVSKKNIFLINAKSVVENQNKLYKSYSELNEHVDELFPIYKLQEMSEEPEEKDFILQTDQEEKQEIQKEME